MTDPQSSEIVAPNPRLVSRLEAAGLRVKARAIDRLAGGHDASHYRIVPEAVVVAETPASVVDIFAACTATGSTLTFRSGGSSLSGQAVGSGILVDTRTSFRRIDVLQDGVRVRVQPGATVRSVNARLARHGRKFGPDPASEIACTIGGVVANNSSGMSCGIEANAYRTLERATLVLATGTVLDTGDPQAGETLSRAEPAIATGLLRLRDRIRNDAASVATLRRLHSIKNTMGYGLNAFLDHDEPVKILEHLIVGSEGTLVFVAEAEFRTVPLLPHAATGLLIFPDLITATAALRALIDLGFAAIELLDADSLRVAQREPDAPDTLTKLTIDDHAALLVEFQEASATALTERLTAAGAMLSSLPLLNPSRPDGDDDTLLTTDGTARAALWHIRKGLYAAVAGNRPHGTTALLEDIAVPVDRLGETCTGLRSLFEEFGYDGSVIFGHAKDGNIHFLISERFDDPSSIERYDAFTLRMVELVLGNGGTLKAEHGTGRIMAPFVQRQYGDELYEIMWEIKRLLDPGMMLNPGVVLTEDASAHVAHLKAPTTVEAEVDRCVECGYCEPACPSRDFTLTPRERIVLRRELEQAKTRGDHELVRQIEADYDYDGVQTCAVDGMCQTACPVFINTGDLVRRLRAEQHGTVEKAGWSAAAKAWGPASRVGGLALSAAHAMPTALPVLATKVGRRIFGADDVPLYSAELPAGGRQRVQWESSAAVAVYFASCTTTMFGPVGDDGVSESFLRLCERAGIEITTPPDLPSLCCGTPWKSKGLIDGYNVMKEKVVASVRAATRGGELPVVCDASSCTEGLQILLEVANAGGIRVIDAVEFADTHLLPRLMPVERVSSLTVHPTCSSTRLGMNESVLRVANAIAETVTVPDDWSCCAFAGDRGLLHPELTASATAAEAAEVERIDASAHCSLNRTCELGMTRATGREYQHILQLLDAATRSS